MLCQLSYSGTKKSRRAATASRHADGSKSSQAEQPGRPGGQETGLPEAPGRRATFLRHGAHGRDFPCPQLLEPNGDSAASFGGVEGGVYKARAARPTESYHAYGGGGGTSATR